MENGFSFSRFPGVNAWATEKHDARPVARDKPAPHKIRILDPSTTNDVLSSLHGVCLLKRNVFVADRRLRFGVISVPPEGDFSSPVRGDSQ